MRHREEWHLVGPRDDVQRIRRPRAHVEAAADVLAGRSTENTPEIAALLNGFAAKGALATEPDPAPAGAVAIVGAGPVADALGGLIGSGATVTDPLTADVIVACADWLPDAEWIELDRTCAGKRALHLCHVDGDDIHLGPFAGPHDRPRYRDLRARRLAAVPDPALLQHIWATSPATHAPVPGPAASAIAAGLIALDVQAALANRDVPSHGRAIEIDGCSGMVRRHPVLPIPEELA